MNQIRKKVAADKKLIKWVKAERLRCLDIVIRFTGVRKAAELVASGALPTTKRARLGQKVWVRPFQDINRPWEPYKIDRMARMTSGDSATGFWVGVYLHRWTDHGIYWTTVNPG